MALFSWTTSPSRPRWDGSRILFEITAGNEKIRCAISRAALEEISREALLQDSGPAGVFRNARGRIERLALEKLRARPDCISGRLSLWADDVDFVPVGGAPVAAHQEIARYQSA